MLIKLFDGCLIEVTEPTPNAVCEVLNLLDHSTLIYPSQVVLVTENILPNDREEGIGAYVLVTPRVKVCLHSPYSSAASVGDEEDYSFEWLADCVNETVLDWFLPRMDDPQFIHLFRNTHPKVVNVILSNDRLFRSLGASSNGADEVIDRLMTQPSLFSVPYMLTNKNARAVLYGLDMLSTRMTKQESWYAIMFVTRLPFIFRAHHENTEVMGQVERLLVKEIDEWPSMLRTFSYPSVVEMCARHPDRLGDYIHTTHLPNEERGVKAEVHMPSSLSNPDDDMVKQVVEWMETNRLVIKELVKQDCHVLWQYRACAMLNSNREMVIYLVRVWPELCNEKVILKRVAAWEDVDVEWVDE